MRRLLLAVAAVLVVLPAGTAAARLSTVQAPGATQRACATAPMPGRAGVVVQRLRPARASLATATLSARRGDWDLALFSASGIPLNGSAGFGGREEAYVRVRGGRGLIVQACRRPGASGAARLRLRLDRLPEARRPERISIVAVPLRRARRDLARLEETGLDVTHAGSRRKRLVVLYGRRDALRLRRAGFRRRTVIRDLAALDRAEARRSRSRARAAAAALPSGRSDYRGFADYGADLKRLVAEQPGLVRPVTIGTSVEGRPIEGVEIARNVARDDDGRPVAAVFGLHHAREWPSGEMPMEFAFTLARGFGSDPRITALLDRVRVLILPMANPDGFMVSRTAGPQPGDDAPFPSGAAEGGAYKRKNCRPTLGDAAVPCALRSPGSGVDLNRNYGAFWGGTGTSTNGQAQNFRGPAPFSEPETEAFHRLSSTRNIVSVITHHTFTEEGVWLRQPGFCMAPPDGCQSPYAEDGGGGAGPFDLVPDEGGMKALGDGMAAATGWLSRLGWAIGEITGATEDWNYFATGAYGFTPEQRGVNFHPSFASAVADEYTGSAPGAAGGVREALLRAAEQAGDRAHHSVITGSAPAGRLLRLVKRFDTPTSIAGLTVPDSLDLTLRVPAGGRFTWDVNPSTRPLVAAAGGTETYVLRCEDGRGTLLGSREVVVQRGREARVDADCGAAAGGPPPQASPRKLRLSLAGTPRRQRRTTVLRRGVRVRARCNRACRLTGTLRRTSTRRTIGTRRTRRGKAGVLRFRVKLSRAGRRAVVRRGARRITVRVRARDTLGVVRRGRVVVRLVGRRR